VLGRGIAGERRQRQAGHDRAGRDNHSAGRAQLGQSRADDVDRPGERDRHGPVEVIGVNLEEASQRDRHRIRDKHVEPAEGVRVSPYEIARKQTIAQCLTMSGGSAFGHSIGYRCPLASVGWDATRLFTRFPAPIEF
jgi:hypothetical protein